MNGLQSINRLNQQVADNQSRTITANPPRRFEDFYVFGSGSQIVVHNKSVLAPGELPLLVLTRVRGGRRESFICYFQPAGSPVTDTVAGGRDEVLAALRDINVTDGEKLLNESFGVAREEVAA